MSGFRKTNYEGASDDAGKILTYSVAAAHTTILAPGDVVKLTGIADANGVAQVDAAAAGNAFEGIIISVDFDINEENLSDTGLPALTAGTVKVDTDPNSVYEVSVSNGPILLVDVGLNSDIVATAATRSGNITRSNMTLNSTGKATGTAQFRIIAIVDGNVTTSQTIIVRPVESQKQIAVGA